MRGILFLIIFTFVWGESSTLIEAKTPYRPKQSSIVVDYDTGRILYANKADDLRYPASLTKMMTLYLLFESLEKRNLSIHDKLKVSRKAPRVQPSKLGLKRGESIKVEDAIRSLIIKSANDVALVVAEAIGGSQNNFSHLMNLKALEMGMDNTFFRNPHGLPDKMQKTTATDMAILARALISHFPQYYPYFKETFFSFRDRKYRSHNRLLGRFKGIDGLKTGFTNASGFNLAASVERENRRIIVVVIGGKSSKERNNRVKQLSQQAFQSIDTIDISWRQSQYIPVLEKEEKWPWQYFRSFAKGQENMSFPVVRRDINGPKSSWGISLGEFNSDKQALSHMEMIMPKIPKRLVKNSELVLMPSSYKQKTVTPKLYGFNERTAYYMCHLLKQHSCHIIKP